VVTPSGISYKLENEQQFFYQGEKPQGVAPATQTSALLGNEAFTSAGHGTENETTSNATDPNVDDNKPVVSDIMTEAVVLGSVNKTDYKITQDSVIKTDAISEDIEFTTNEINGIDSYGTARPTLLAGVGNMNAGRRSYLVSGNPVGSSISKHLFRDIQNVSNGASSAFENMTKGIDDEANKDLEDSLDLFLTPAKKIVKGKRRAIRGGEGVVGDVTGRLTDAAIKSRGIKAGKAGNEPKVPKRSFLLDSAFKFVNFSSSLFATTVKASEQIGNTIRNLQDELEQAKDAGLKGASEVLTSLVTGTFNSFGMLVPDLGPKPTETPKQTRPTTIWESTEGWGNDFSPSPPTTTAPTTTVRTFKRPQRRRNRRSSRSCSTVAVKLTAFAFVLLAAVILWL
jgi:hypothetical protein